jgi:hypothetical protein
MILPRCLTWGGRWHCAKFEPVCLTRRPVQKVVASTPAATRKDYAKVTSDAKLGTASATPNSSNKNPVQFIFACSRRGLLEQRVFLDEFHSNEFCCVHSTEGFHHFKERETVAHSLEFPLNGRRVVEIATLCFIATKMKS